MNAVLANLSEADRGAVIAAGAVTRHTAGEAFFDVGDMVDHVHFLMSGAASCTLPMNDGSAVEVAMLGADRAIGMMTANGPVLAFAKVRAEIDVEALTVTTEAFANLVLERPGVRAMAGTQAAALVNEIAKSAACNAVHKVEPRLAKCLLRFSDRSGGRPLRLTQDHMSRMLGVSRTTLNAVAQGLQAKGALRYSRGKLDIVDHGRLRGLACSCYSPPGFFTEG